MSRPLPRPRPAAADEARNGLPGLNAILDFDLAARAGWTVVDLAAACLAGGARFLQVRGKHAPASALLEAAAAVADRAHREGALVVVNDRADVAKLAGADGVHVGQDDLDPTAARRVLGSGAVVGRSTHTVEQIEAALLEPISYLAIGPVFETTTKTTGYAPVGLDGVRAASRRARPRGIPVVAIGGITPERAADVIEAGAASVAVLSGLLAGGDPGACVRAYLARIGTAGGV